MFIVCNIVTISQYIFILLQGDQGLPGLGIPGPKGEKVSVDVAYCFLH